VGLRTLNERINRSEPLVHQMREQPIIHVPAVVPLDGDPGGAGLLGGWHTRHPRLAECTRRRAHPVGTCVEPALETGRAIRNRTHTGVLDQRCLFHTLRNAAEEARSELKGQDTCEQRKHLMEQAKAISQAESASQAKERLQLWATSEKDVEHTLVYSVLDAITWEWIRTTTLLLERTNRELRRTFPQAVSFGSQIGAEVALSEHVQRLHARWRWTDTSWYMLPTLSSLPSGRLTLREGYNTCVPAATASVDV